MRSCTSPHISPYLPISRPGARCGRAPDRGRRPEEPADHRAADRRPQHERGRHAPGRHRVRSERRTDLHTAPPQPVAAANLEGRAAAGAFLRLCRFCTPFYFAPTRVSVVQRRLCCFSHFFVPSFLPIWTRHHDARAATGSGERDRKRGLSPAGRAITTRRATATQDLAELTGRACNHIASSELAELRRCCGASTDCSLAGSTSAQTA